MNPVYRSVGLVVGTAIVAGLALAQGPASNASFFDDSS